MNERAKEMGDYSTQGKLWRCVICRKMTFGYGNNAEPVKKGRCCDWCNISVVIPARIRMMRKEENNT